MKQQMRQIDKEREQNVCGRKRPREREGENGKESTENTLMMKTQTVCTHKEQDKRNRQNLREQTTWEHKHKSK